MKIESKLINQSILEKHECSTQMLNYENIPNILIDFYVRKYLLMKQVRGRCSCNSFIIYTMHKPCVKWLRCFQGIEERCSSLCSSVLKLENCSEGKSRNPFAVNYGHVPSCFIVLILICSILGFMLKRFTSIYILQNRGIFINIGTLVPNYQT